MFFEVRNTSWKMTSAFKDIEKGMFWKNVIDKYQLNCRNDIDSNIISAIINHYKFVNMTKRRK